MTEGEQQQLLKRVFAVIRDRAGELRRDGDYYDGAYSADELMKLPAYIAPRMHPLFVPDHVVLTQGEFETLWQAAYSSTSKPEWLNDLLDRVAEQYPQTEDEA